MKVLNRVVEDMHDFFPVGTQQFSSDNGALEVTVYVENGLAMIRLSFLDHDGVPMYSMHMPVEMWQFYNQNIDELIHNAMKLRR